MGSRVIGSQLLAKIATRLASQRSATNGSSNKHSQWWMNRRWNCITKVNCDSFTLRIISCANKQIKTRASFPISMREKCAWRINRNHRFAIDSCRFNLLANIFVYIFRGFCFCFDRSFLCDSFLVDYLRLIDILLSAYFISDRQRKISKFISTVTSRKKNVQLIRYDWANSSANGCSQFHLDCARHTHKQVYG